MRKFVITIILLTAIFCILIPLCLSVASAAEPVFSLSPGEKTADYLARTGKAALTGILVITDGTNDAKVIIYDNTAASGTVKYETTIKGADHYGGRIWSFPLIMDKGIYVSVTGTGASYVVEFIELP